MNLTLEKENIFQELDGEKAKLFLEAGVHYGQPTSKRSPKMDEFVFGVSQTGMQLIDLNLTWQKIQEVGLVLEKLVGEDKNIVFVGTNERAVSTVLQEYSEKYDLHNITSRWLGGTLTNPVTRNRINYLRELESMETTGLMESIPAKEKSFLGKKLKKLRKNLGGLKKIKGAMHAIVIIDPVHDINATLEAFKKSRNLTIIAIADTNCSFAPDTFDLIIPCNTSSLRSLRLIMDELIGFMEKGKQAQVQKQSSITQGPSRRNPAVNNNNNNRLTTRKQAPIQPQAPIQSQPKQEMKPEIKAEKEEKQNNTESK
jgi:small subunit ribosomal protein S2